METTGKPFLIDKARVYEAYKAVKSNRGAAGVDGQTLEMFEKDLAGNLYKIWNRMSSGGIVTSPLGLPSVTFSRAMSLANPLWGAPRIHGELE